MKTKTEDSLRKLWHNTNQIITHIIRVPERAQREKWAENFFEELMTELPAPKMEKKTDIQIHETQRSK